MTAETQPLPDVCPLCQAQLVPRDKPNVFWFHQASDCPLRGLFLYPSDIAAWNRRAPAGAGWRDISSADRYGPALLLHDPALVDPDFNPGGLVEGFWQDEYRGAQDGEWIAAVWCDDHDMWETRIVHPTHWQPLPAPPGATPAAPPAPDAALREALREIVEAVRPYGWLNIDQKKRLIAKADVVLAEADAGRARDA